MTSTLRTPSSQWLPARLAPAFFLLASLTASLFVLGEGVASAAVCTNPGKDGPANLTGIINSYYPGVVGTTVSAGSTSIAIGSVDTSGGGSSTAIQPGDLILVMQMQDADIVTTNSSAYGGSSPGSGYTALNNSGVYEYAQVSWSYAGGGVSPVVVTSGLQYTYRSADFTSSAGQRRYQVIRVPQNSSATLTGTVTAAPWNGSTGGVMAVDVAGALTWNGNTIDVSGRGFRGAAGMWLNGRDSGTQPAYATTDYATTLATRTITIPPTAANKGVDGVKGEGIAGTPRYVFVPTTTGEAANTAGSILQTQTTGDGYPGGQMARGAPGNGGGGGTDGDTAGNSQNTGGGGGGGYSAGGMGGYGWTSGTPPGSQTGGYGGTGVAMGPGRLVMGGGGGSGSTNNATGSPSGSIGLASSGAPGGGIVLIRAKTITGTGTVSAKGTSGNANVCNDASGGGGAGGSVLIFASDNNGNVGTVTVNASGGSGGSNTGVGGTGGDNTSPCGVCSANNCPHGPGGGGGGGFVALSSTSNATINVSGSANGTTAPSPTSTAPYGSSASPGGYQVYTVNSTDIPGASPSPLCYPALTVNKVTTKANTVRGDNTSYTVTVTNPSGYGAASGVTLTDVLPSPFNFASMGTVTLTGSATRSPTTNPTAGATSPVWSTFNMPGGSSLSFSFVANVPAATAAGTYQNPATVTYDDPTRTTAGQTVTPGGTYAAGGFVSGANYVSSSSTQEDVTVRVPATIIKTFSPVSIPAGGTTQLSILITNPNAVALSAAGFTDAMPSGMIAVGGAVTVTGSGCTGYLPTTITAGSTTFTQSGGAIPASGTCAFSINVTAGTGATYTNVLPYGSFVNNLNVINTSVGSGALLARPTITKSFTVAAVAQNVDAEVSFVIANPNASQALTGVTFTDTFPTNLVAATGAVTVTGSGCTGFLPTTTTLGATSFSLTAGTLPAGGSCTVKFNVRSAVAGNYANTSGGVTTNETLVAGANSNTASLGVGVLNVSKVFTPALIASGTGSSTVTLTVANPSGVAQTAGDFTDTLVNMAINGAQSVGGTCTWTPSVPTLANNQTALSFTGMNVPSGGCNVTFTVKSSTTGTQTNATSGIQTALLPRGPASNTATLTVTTPPTITKSLSSTTIQTGDSTTVTFTIVNGSTVPLTGAGFSDVLVTNLKVFGSGSVAAGGTCLGASTNSFTGGAGGTLTFTGLTIPIGTGGCTVTIPITSTTISTATGYTNATSGVSSTEAATGAVSNTVNLIVVASPTIAKAFGTSPISPNGTSLITFTLTNPSAIALTGGTFTDTLTSMQVNAAGAAGGTCTGASSNTFTAGQTGTLTFSGLTIPASPTTCTVTLTITTSTSGSLTNTSSGVTTTQTPTVGTVSNTATLVVYTPPTVSLGFSPGIVMSTAAVPAATTTLTITLTNPNGVALTGTAFTETLSNMQIAATGAAGGTCTGASGNSFTAAATSLSFSGITVPANGSCTVTLVLNSSSISPATGWPAQTSGATSTQTPVAGAVPLAAYLTVISYATISKSFSPSAIGSGGTSTITFTLTNSNSVDLYAARFTDNFPTNMTTTAVSQNYIGTGRGTCTGAIPSAGSTAVTSRTITGLYIPANSSCTVMIDVTSSTVANYSNATTGVITAQTGTSAGPVSNTATLGVGRVGISKAFSPTTIGAGEQSTLTFTLVNSVASAFTGNVSFTDTFPSGLTVASPLTTTNTCSGTLKNAGNVVNLAIGDSGIGLSAGTIAASSTCTISVKVTASSAGTLSNTSTGVTYSSGPAITGPVSNTTSLTVVQKPTIAKAFSPTSIDAYRNSTMTFTVTNPNSTALSSCNFTDTLTGFFVSNPPAIGGTCVSVTNSPTLAYGGTALSLTIPTLNAGSCTITVPVTASAAGSFTNTASGVKCSQTVSAGTASNTASIAFAKLPIAFMKGANLVNVAPGSAVTYDMTYSNPNSTMALQNIVITDTVPVYMTFTSASCGTLPASITSCTISAPAVGSSGTITWTLGGTLDAGATGTVRLTATVK